MPAQRTTTKKKDPQLGRPARSSSGSENSSSWETVSGSSSVDTSNALGLDFMTMGRPLWDFHRQYDPEEALEEMPKEEVEKLEKEFNEQGKKHFKGDPTQFPGHPWIISKQAFKIYQDMDVGLQKRDTDGMGLHFYNDTHGYGVGEVIQIHFLSFAKEYQRTSPRPGKLWMHLEAFAWLFGDHEMEIAGLWSGIDDGEGVGHTVAIIGLAILTTLNQLEQDNLWDTVPNLPIILSIYMLWFTNFSDAMECAEDSGVHSFPAMIRIFAEKRGVSISGVYDVDSCLKEFGTDDLDEEKVRLVQSGPTKDKFKFKEQWKSFKTRISPIVLKGGSAYDITKMSRKARIEASWDGKDPLAGHGPMPSSGIY